METAEIVEDILAHYGTQGMKWGVRNTKNTSTSTATKSSTISGKSSGVKGLEHYPKRQTAAMADVAKKMEKGYGLKINEYIPLTDRENKKGYIAYVEAKGKTGSTVLHLTNDPKLVSGLNKLEKDGWFVPSSKKSLESMLTHESAHSMLHQVNVQKTGFMKSKTTPAAIDSMRNSAWDKAKTQATKDGDYVPGKGIRRLITPTVEGQLAKKTSKYAESSLFTEEIEAEMFAAYHWSPNPPKFVDAFMSGVHENMNKKVKPFSGRKV